MDDVAQKYGLNEELHKLFRNILRQVDVIFKSATNVTTNVIYVIVMISSILFLVGIYLTRYLP